MSEILFYALSALSVLSALGMILARNPVHSALLLIFTFFMIAALYVLLNAQFLAVVHLIVYAGAIMVLFLFVLMLLNLNNVVEPLKSDFWKIAATVGAGSLALVLVASLRGSIQLASPAGEYNNQVGLVQNLGRVLFTDFVLPFELAGILFLSAMVGAVLLGKKNISG